MIKINFLRTTFCFSRRLSNIIELIIIRSFVELSDLPDCK